jgi:hypothetical protein
MTNKINHRSYLFGGRGYDLYIFVFAMAYGLGLSSLPVDAFVDRNNYLVYAGHSTEIIFRYIEQQPWSVFFNEPLWLGVNVFLGSFLFPDNVLRTIIFTSSFLTAYLVLRSRPNDIFLLLFVLLLPQVLKNNIIHLRQGLAIAVFLCGWFCCRKNRRYLLFISACLIHSSFFIIMFLIVLNNFLIRFRLPVELRAVVISVGGIFVGLLGLWLAGFLGARQAGEYAGGAAEVSGLAFAFWAVIAGLFVLQGRAFLRSNSIQFSFIIFYLSTYFLLPVTARVLESGLILIFISLLGLTSYRRYLFLAALSFYFIFQWIPRLALPGFGWGIENYM